MLGVLTADCAVLITSACTFTIFGNNSYHPLVICPSITLRGRHFKKQFCSLQKASLGIVMTGALQEVLLSTLKATLLLKIIILIGGFDPFC